MATETKIVKHFFHLRGNLRRVFMADIAGATPGIIDKIVVALDALTGAVISMIEHHRQHGLLGGVLIAIALGE
jgi:predicted RNA-binding protein with EMAP domain